MVPVKRFLAAAAVCVMLGGCASAGPENRETPGSPASEPVSAPEPVSRQVTLVAAGDNLIHDVIWMQASRRAGGNGYDFAPAYEAIAPIVAEADFAFVNQETVLAGAELPLSNYPRFCSPPEVGETMLDLGFNLIATANNHCFDQGEAGVRLSQEFWDSHPEAAVAGSYADAAHRDRIAVTENEDGVRVALIGRHRAHQRALAAGRQRRRCTAPSRQGSDPRKAGSSPGTGGHCGAEPALGAPREPVSPPKPRSSWQRNWQRAAPM